MGKHLRTRLRLRVVFFTFFLLFHFNFKDTYRTRVTLPKILTRFLKCDLEGGAPNKKKKEKKERKKLTFEKNKNRIRTV